MFNNKPHTTSDMSWRISCKNVPVVNILIVVFFFIILIFMLYFEADLIHDLIPRQEMSWNFFFLLHTLHSHDIKLYTKEYSLLLFQILPPGS